MLELYFTTTHGLTFTFTFTFLLKNRFLSVVRASVCHSLQHMVYTLECLKVWTKCDNVVQAGHKKALLMLLMWPRFYKARLISHAGDIGVAVCLCICPIGGGILSN